MSRPDLIKQFKKEYPNLTQLEIQQILVLFEEGIFNALKDAKNIELRGFGRLYCKKLKENYNARNPATHELIYKPERVKIRFKASKKLNKIINE